MSQGNSNNQSNFVQSINNNFASAKAALAQMQEDFAPASVTTTIQEIVEDLAECEVLADKTNTINASSTTAQYPSAKGVYDFVTERGDVPVGYSLFSEHSLGAGWIADGNSATTFSATAYPVLWDMLTKVYNGTVTFSDMKVCTEAEATAMTANLTGSELVTAKQNLAFYFVINTTDQTFKLPRCAPKNRCIGQNESAVIGFAGKYGGSGSVSDFGYYTETGNLVRIVKATKTVNGETVTYHRAYQWCDDTDEYTAQDVTEDNIITFHGVGIHCDTTQELASDNYYMYACIAKDTGVTESNGKKVLEIVGLAKGIFCMDGDATGFDLAVPLYDETIEATAEAEANIPEGETEAYIVYVIQGIVAPPEVSSYNLSTRLYTRAV